jgi:putative transcription antitermination factor YqgF
MKYLGIDFGTKKIGLALSDEAGMMGFPHATITRTAQVADEIAALIREKGVDEVVIGESRGLDGLDNPVMVETRAFATALAEATNAPIHFEPETFTTQAARRYPDGTRMAGSPDVDASAAALILTSFLEHTTPPMPIEETNPNKLPPAEPAPAAAEPAHISIDDFSKVEVKVGTVLSAERVPETDKLLRLMIDVGEAEPRQIVSGIASYVSEPETLVGRQLAFVTNLAPRKLRGLESNGMLFAVGEGDTFAFMTPDRPVPPGTSAH